MPAREILGQAQKHLRSAQTLEVEERYTISVAYDGKPAGRVCRTVAHILFKRPDRLVYREGDREDWCDGKTTWVYIPSVKKYSVNALDAHLRQRCADHR
jgi:outer membrane lipoprotein-sorting protein